MAEPTATDPRRDLPSVHYYTTVMQQLGALGWQHVAEVDDDLRHLTLTHTYGAACPSLGASFSSAAE